MKNRWKSLGLLVIVCSLILPFPFRVFAAEEVLGESSEVPVREIVVTGGEEGIDYQYLGQKLEILTGTPLTLSGKTEEGSVFVSSGSEADLTLDNLQIHKIALGESSDSPFYLESGSTQITLAPHSSNAFVLGLGESSVPTYQGAGMYVGAGAHLTLGGSGSLLAQSDLQGGAGIGAMWEKDSGTISILDGDIKAIGGKYAAGIGGSNGETGSIELLGGTITATGGEGAAGIGSGAEGESGRIVLRDGTIEAQGGNQAAGIGSGKGGSAVRIQMEGGRVHATGGIGGAGIGTGACTKATTYGSFITLTGGTLEATGGELAAGVGGGAGLSAEIHIQDTEIKATGGKFAPGIGNGFRGEGSRILVDSGEIIAQGGQGASGVGDGVGLFLETSTFLEPSFVEEVKKAELPFSSGRRVSPYHSTVEVSIYGGNIVAMGGEYGAGLGNQVSIFDGAIQATGGEGSAGIGSSPTTGVSTILIAGGQSSAMGGRYAAGVGNGGNTLAGGSILVESGTLTATGGDSATGIGGGTFAPVEKLRITGGEITAKGGSVQGELVDDTLTGGAGIGTGSQSRAPFVPDITITGGTISAQGGFHSAGVGVGSQSDSVSIHILGGELSATGCLSGAGIGGAEENTQDRQTQIALVGGTIRAQGGKQGVGIGGRYYDKGQIRFGTATIEAQGGKEEKTAIGSSTYGAVVPRDRYGNKLRPVTLEEVPDAEQLLFTNFYSWDKTPKTTPYTIAVPLLGEGPQQIYLPYKMVYDVELQTEEGTTLQYQGHLNQGVLILKPQSEGGLFIDAQSHWPLLLLMALISLLVLLYAFRKIHKIRKQKKFIAKEVEKAVEELKQDDQQRVEQDATENADEGEYQGEE